MVLPGLLSGCRGKREHARGIRMPAARHENGLPMGLSVGRTCLCLKPDSPTQRKPKSQPEDRKARGHAENPHTQYSRDKETSPFSARIPIRISVTAGT